VVYLPNPLKPEEYARWILRSDIGLFLYDPERYYAQLSSVLGEFLAAGVPVIVPAGCWLAEQIAEPIYRHQEELADRLGTLHTVPGEQVLWETSGPSYPRNEPGGGSLTFAGAPSALAGELVIPEGAAELLCSFRWLSPTEAGTYLRLHCEQFDESGNRVDQFSTVLGPRAGGRAVPALVHVHKRGRCLRLTWQNAYHGGIITVGDVRLSFLAARPEGGHSPYGAVGLIAADLSQVPRLLRDLLTHYPHYRDTAESFARTRGETYHPRHTLQQLLGGNGRAEAWSPALRRESHGCE
jgi:hypothetical protein